MTTAPPAPADPTDPTGSPWSVVVPVKGGPLAKSRLRAPDGVNHAHLATALALDTVAAVIAAVGARQVVVVTSDPGVARAVSTLGARVLADPGRGLDRAVTAGTRHPLDPVRPTVPTGRVAALLGDIPSLQPADLLVALATAAAHPLAVVPDADGVGSVLLTAARPGLLRPRFGGASARAHEEVGAVRLDLDLPRLRRDVDDEQSLRTALCLGVGTHTAALLAHLLAAPGAGEERAVSGWADEDPLGAARRAPRSA